MSKEALKLALEALERTAYLIGIDGLQKEWWHVDESITAIKEALAQPKQEPALDCTRVACMGNGGCIGNCWSKDTTPAQRKPLTDEQLHALFDSPLTPTGIEWARKIEAAHGIKEKNNG